MDPGADRSPLGSPAASPTSSVRMSNYRKDTCSICLERYTTVNPSMLYMCGHAYHLQCAETWMQRSANCPFCWKELKEGGLFHAPEDDLMRGTSSASLDCMNVEITMAEQMFKVRNTPESDPTSDHDDANSTLCTSNSMTDPLRPRRIPFWRCLFACFAWGPP